jgi:hypothetical protein
VEALVNRLTRANAKIIEIVDGKVMHAFLVYCPLMAVFDQSI